MKHDPDFAKQADHAYGVAADELRLDDHGAQATLHGAVCDVLADRARAGNAAGANAEEVGPLAQAFARRAVALAGI